VAYVRTFGAGFERLPGRGSARATVDAGQRTAVAARARRRNVPSSLDELLVFGATAAATCLGYTLLTGSSSAPARRPGSPRENKAEVRAGPAASYSFSGLGGTVRRRI